MNKKMLTHILETVMAYYLINEDSDVLTDEAKEDLKDQMKYLDGLIGKIEE